LNALYCLSDRDRTEQACLAAAALSPAWKTGTSSGHRDAWCAAVTLRRTVVVWLGNADATGSDALVGQDAAAPLALKILSESDPNGTGFSPPPNFRADIKTVSAPLAADVSKVSLISPINGQEIVCDPALPPTQQRLPLRASGPIDEHLWWFVDGECLGESASDRPLWWSPTAGQHEIRAIASTGQVATADIRIR
jgi:penicillin-binding protein 1C